MSIGSIGSYSSGWCQQQQATQAAQPTSATTSSSSTTHVASSGTTLAGSNLSSFLQAFSADLQAMLVQVGSPMSTSASPAASTPNATSTSTAGTSSAATTTTSNSNAPGQTASADQPDGVHHHHRHHGSGGQDGPMQKSADQLVGDIGQSLQNSTQTASSISNSASSFATDIVQAIRAYNSSPPSSGNGPLI